MCCYQPAVATVMDGHMQMVMTEDNRSDQLWHDMSWKALQCGHNRLRMLELRNPLSIKHDLHFVYWNVRIVLVGSFAWYDATMWMVVW